MLEPKIIKYLIISALLFILVQPVFSWFYADDYCLIPQIQDLGIFNFLKNCYLNWDGRVASPIYIFSMSSLYIELPWLGPFYATIWLVLSSYLLLAFSSYKRNFYNLAWVMIIVWSTLIFILSQTHYWTTGSFYSLEMLLVILAVYLFKNQNAKKLIFFVPFFLIIGMMSPNAVIALLFIFTSEIMYSKIVLKENQFVKLLLIVSITIGFLIVILSPGNKSRMELAGSTSLKLGFFDILINLKKLVSAVYEFNSPVFWGLLAFAIIGFTINTKNNKAKQEVNSLHNSISFVYKYRILVALLLSVFFFLPLPGFYIHSPRVNIHFITFGMIFIFCNLSAVPFVKHYLNHIKIVFLILFISFIGIQSFDGYITYKLMKERVAYYKKNEGKDVLIKRDKIVRGPIIRKFHDIEEDSTYWLNQCVCRHFKLKTIRLEEAPKPLTYNEQMEKNKK